MSYNRERAVARRQTHRASPKLRDRRPPLDMLMTLQGSSVRCRRALGERHGGRASGMGELDLSELD
jgi:hypothetical protein